MVDLVSIIVPVYNDPEGIEQTLHSLLFLQYPEDAYEIIVVDNGSTDKTRKVAEEIVDSVDSAQVVVEDDIQSSYAARNTGVEHSAGDLLVFVDADMTVEQNWLAELVEYFGDSNVSYTGCDVSVYLPSERRTVIGYYSLAEEFPIEFYLENLDFAPTCCMAVRRSVIEDVGPFVADIVSGGDVEFGRRVADAGYVQGFAEDAKMYHPARMRFSDHFKKSMRHGRGREQRYQRYRDSMHSRAWHNPRNFLPPHPVRFLSGLRGEYSVVLLSIFYTLTYVFKLGELLGQVEERFSDR